MQRNKKIDYIRAFAIITVVIGHSIQYGSGPDYFCLEDPVFKFIYSFHMPLFMLISGYLFYSSLNRHSFPENICSRITSLFIPIILWNIVPFIIYTWHDRPHTLRYLFNTYLSTMISNSWFLWAILYCSLAVLMVNRFFKDNILIYLGGLILTFILPDSHNLSLYKFMYPYFIIGYFGHKHFGRITGLLQSPPRRMRRVTAVFLIIFLVLLCFYDNDSYIYTTGYTLIGKEDVFLQLGIDAYRFIIGLFGSIAMILILSPAFEKSGSRIIDIMTLIGSHSLGIYMISGLIFNYVLPGLMSGLKTVNYLLAALESFVILLLSLMISICLKRFKLTNLLFFGGRK